MHYLIDGYNLLFKSFEDNVSLKEQRDTLIEYLRQSIKQENLYTLVFDGHFKMGLELRTHYGDLEIVYSSKGETADEWILERVQRGKAFSFTVVTSDKSLSKACRFFGTNTETVAAFLKRLVKVSKPDPLVKEGRVVQKVKRFPLISGESVETSIKPALKTEKPLPHVPPESCFDYYLYKFENPNS